MRAQVPVQRDCPRDLFVGDAILLTRNLRLLLPIATLMNRHLVLVHRHIIMLLLLLLLLSRLLLLHVRILRLLLPLRPRHPLLMLPRRYSRQRTRMSLLLLLLLLFPSPKQRP